MFSPLQDGLPRFARNDRSVAIHYLLGCKSTTLFLVRALKASYVHIHYLVTIDPAAGEKNEVADYYDLKDEVEKNGHYRLYGKTVRT